MADASGRGAVFVSLPFLVSFAPFFARSDDGKLMLPAEVIAQAADVVLGDNENDVYSQTVQQKWIF